MAYSELLADRIRRVLQDKKVLFEEKKMMGGLCFMVNDKMCCGIHFDKKREMDLLMARIGEDASADALNKVGCFPMDFTGRPMKGYVFVTAESLDLDSELEYWLQLSLDFNPLAAISKKK